MRTERKQVARIPVLMYHRVGPVRRNSIVPGQYVSPSLMKTHLRVLKLLGYPILTPDEAMAGKKGALITFDDGYKSYVDTAGDLLKSAGGTGLVFLVTGYVGLTNGWDECVGDVTEPLMNWEDIKKLRKDGHHFGSHTLTHPRLNITAPDTMLLELQDSKRSIETHLGEPCRWFCYPYGAMDSAVKEAVQKTGYEAAFATTKGAWVPGTDDFTVPRVNIRSDTSAAVLAFKIFRAVVIGR